MQYLEEFLEANDGHEIPVRVWRPKSFTHILVIAHGMAEYCERYAAFAEWLTNYNIAVVALNHRGHGMDCDFDKLGFFASSHGWQKVLDDLDQTISFTKKELKGAPIVLMGHSMGSFIAQCYIQQNPASIDSLILMSTNRVKELEVKAAQAMISVLKKIQGPMATSKLFNTLTFHSFNRQFKPNRTEFDWLSRDIAHVDAYINDPYCGFLCTNQFWRDFLFGLASINVSSWPAKLPIHIVSGSHDPLGEMGKGIIS
jgi:alpha-beta hydrolase superfamily lysophospholipase